MSMNLHCEEVELWQTPTYITYMCYSNNDGGWKGILYRYTQWVKQTSSGTWANEQDFKEANDRVKRHLKELGRFKKLTFSVR